MSYVFKVPKERRKKWIKKIDELLDIEFEKTVNKIREDIELQTFSVIDKIKAGYIKKGAFEVKGYINFLNMSSATLPIIMNRELTSAYVEASGRMDDDLMYFDRYTKKYDLFVLSSKERGIHVYSFKFYKGENIHIFLTKTGKSFCTLLKNYFKQKNVKLKFSSDEGAHRIKILVQCDKNNIK